MIPIEKLQNLEKETHIQESGLPSSSQRQNGDRMRRGAVESPARTAAGCAPEWNFGRIPLASLIGIPVRVAA
jgi:hypothetical protein